MLMIVYSRATRRPHKQPVLMEPLKSFLQTNSGIEATQTPDSLHIQLSFVGVTVSNEPDGVKARRPKVFGGRIRVGPKLSTLCSF
ncbi:MAG TPA: hypothetical protein DCZ95_17670 [Verrucomicrobia bacterium]|nr:MAG: hypothetical protein A2X46_12915 [Lentisphaerae bacterium GWF2_57_35]HBA85916.1 hypothetical protein [Verrucomicrobiota bacterium]